MEMVAFPASVMSVCRGFAAVACVDVGAGDFRVGFDGIDHPSCHCLDSRALNCSPIELFEVFWPVQLFGFLLEKVLWE